jgi:hypothetical protein
MPGVWQMNGKNRKKEGAAADNFFDELIPVSFNCLVIWHTTDHFQAII